MATSLEQIFAKLRGPAGPVPTGPVAALAVGLGNPGREYEGTRHNAGFLALDCLAEDLGVKVDRLKFKSLCGEAMVGGRRVLLMKPSTYMNNSGQAVAEAMRFYKLTPQQLLVLCDDVTQEVGRIRIRRKGSDGGHNGLKSIIYLTGSDAFVRVRIGVGKKPRPDYDLADWVLGKFPKEQFATLDEVFGRAAQAARLILEGKTDEAMNRYSS